MIMHVNESLTDDNRQTQLAILEQGRILPSLSSYKVLTYPKLSQQTLLEDK